MVPQVHKQNIGKNEPTKLTAPPPTGNPDFFSFHGCSALFFLPFHHISPRENQDKNDDDDMDTAISAKVPKTFLHSSSRSLSRSIFQSFFARIFCPGFILLRRLREESEWEDPIVEGFNVYSIAIACEKWEGRKGCSRFSLSPSSSPFLWPLWILRSAERS